MKILLSAPLRTSIELPLRYSGQRPSELVDAVQIASKNIVAELGSGYDIQSAIVADDRPLELYKRLDQDSIPSTLLPLLTINFFEKLQLEQITIPGCSNSRLQDASIHIYDRTLGLLELTVDFDEISNLSEFENNADDWTVLFVKSLLDKLHSFSQVCFKILIKPQANSREGIMQPANRKSCFFDVYEPSCTSLNLSLMWVSRVIFTDSPTIEKHPWENWTQGQISDRIEVSVGNQSGVLCVGNSVVFGKLDFMAVNSIQKGLRLANLIFSAVHVISKNLRTVHGDFIGSRIPAIHSAELTATIRNALDIVERDYEDGMQGIQGGRRTVATNYLTVWSFEALLHTSHKRIGSLFSLTQELIVRRNARYSRLVELALSIIGGIALLDFSLNLMTFSRSPSSKEDGVFGLIDFVKEAPEDQLLFLLTAVIVWISLNKFLRK